MPCTGSCCAAFPYPASPEQLRRRWTHEGPLRYEVSYRQRRDDLYIADMLIELSPEEVNDRGDEFDLWRLFDSPEHRFQPTEKWYPMYTCRHWDHGSKLCMAYEQRPKMCADFPYAHACEHGCDYRPGEEIMVEWSTYEVREAARAEEKRKAEDSNPSV